MGKQVVKPAPVITGRGCDAQGRQTFSVESRTTEGVSYQVVRHAVQLTCTCKAAAEFGRICCHRKAVHDLLVAERDAMMARVAAASQRADAAPMYRDNRPFSIFAN